MWHGLVILMVCLYSFENFVTDEARIYDLNEIGILVLTASVMVSTIEVFYLH
jgi:hypothetical protein